MTTHRYVAKAAERATSEVTLYSLEFMKNGLLDFGCLVASVPQ